MVVLSENGLQLVRFPCLVQQYHDHGAVFFKVYVLGDEVMVFRRRSLPDLNPFLSNENIALGFGLPFDSRYSYPTLEDFYVPNPATINHNHNNNNHHIHHSKIINNNNNGVDKKGGEYSAKILEKEKEYLSQNQLRVDRTSVPSDDANIDSFPIPHSK